MRWVEGGLPKSSITGAELTAIGLSVARLPSAVLSLFMTSAHVYLGRTCRSHLILLIRTRGNPLDLFDLDAADLAPRESAPLLHDAPHIIRVVSQCPILFDVTRKAAVFVNRDDKR